MIIKSTNIDSNNKMQLEEVKLVEEEKDII